MKFKIIEKFIISLWYIKNKQEGSHMKYLKNSKTLIIPKHKEISRGTLNNIFKIISSHNSSDKNEIVQEFLIYYKKQ